ncbi:hypothetical protein ACVSQB_17375 [Bradyrhizobium elkanii]|uniref:hypothetical protein n=1 Tax=Bradyrhizobium sp. BRP56 TaxID=2793819 RepID=UPI001CD336F1|nr:hypothetical protein [Bradyrhizobium sp. BRP56]MCA1401938.1 hypothetical protein [Bradyrhizobium sp. BRP56]
MSVNDHWWKSFREEKFKHDCVEIELVRNGVKPLTYRGPGEVWQDDDGVLSFKCFAQSEARDAVSSILNQAALEVGKLIPDEAYYSIKVTTFDTMILTAENVWIGLNCNLATGHAIASGKLRSLRHVSPDKRALKSHSMRLLFLKQQRQDWRPFYDAVIRVDEIGCTLKFEMLRESDVLVEIIGDAAFVPNFETRVIEALRYVLGKVVHLSLIETRTNGETDTTLMSPVREVSTRFPAPLSSHKHADDVHRMFVRYLVFVNSNTSSEFVHPCSMWLRNACDASAGSTEAEVIVLGVTVEGLANLLPFERAPLDQALVDVRDALLKLIGELAPVERVRKRIEGLLGQLNNVRATDRLQPLVDSGHLASSCLDAWKELRNKAVHPSSSKLEGLDNEQLQALIDLIHRVYVCMYQITFALIGYQGAYSNYAAKRFPVESYPLTAASEVAAEGSSA